MAVELARSPGRLASLRAKLDAQRLACALFDTARYVRHLEAAYRGMVARQPWGGGRMADAARHDPVPAPVVTGAPTATYELPPALPWTVLPMFFFTFGSSIIAPGAITGRLPGGHPNGVHPAPARGGAAAIQT